MTLSEQDRKVALEALNALHNDVDSSGWPTDYIWFRAWELATQAAYERARQTCDEFADMYCQGDALSAVNHCVELLRNLSKGQQPWLT